MTTALKDLYDGSFEQYVAEGKSDPTPLTTLEQAYVMAFGGPLFVIGHQYPDFTEDQLRECLDWCLYYGRPKEDYPKAAELGFDRQPEDIPEGAVI